MMATACSPSSTHRGICRSAAPASSKPGRSIVALAQSTSPLHIGPAKISPIYPPAGIAVAATLILGPRILPAVFIGQFLHGFPLLEHAETTLAMYALANTGTGTGSIMEALIALAVLRRFAGTWHPFDRARHVVVFLLGSCLAAALVCGAIGTFSLWAGGFVPDDEVRITQLPLAPS